MKPADGLLERLRDYMGFSYISDFRRVFRTGRFQIEDPPAWMTDETYSPEEWTQAVRYITGSTRSFATTQEAVRFLLEHIDSLRPK